VWVDWRACEAEPETEAPLPGVVVTTYDTCAGDAVLVLAAWEGGHAYPRGEEPFETAAVVYEFFSDYALDTPVDQ